ncbi:DUF6126 family protein [Streptomyces sp. NBC_00280]|uniref:DUF6126 family protein n=1 Tax=Streptomyces sp. NBC_00280 TaxID=2975699 RepID=UPI00325665AB
MSEETEAAGQPESTRREEKRTDRESWIERGVAIRAGFYVFGTHLFAGFVWLLMYLGEHANK